MSEAKKYFDSAEIKYNRGDYTGAIADYRQSHRARRQTMH